NCKVVFEGLIVGDEYFAFMKGCHLGLNPQKWGDYMLYAYPSKVLVYLMMGLNVVTSPLQTLKASQLSMFLNYTKDESPQELAKAIMGAKLRNRDELLNISMELHKNFVSGLKTFL